MFFICKVQPKFPEKDIEKSPALGLLFDKNEKKEAVLKFAEDLKKGKKLPICENHAGGDNYGFEVPEKDIKGEMRDLILNSDEELMGIGEIYPNETASHLVQEMLMKNQNWGVSLWLDVRDVIGDKRYKNLTHVALTKEPAMGKYGSYIYEFSHIAPPLEKILATKYYGIGSNNNNNNNKENNSFASPELIEKWKKHGIFNSPSNIGTEIKTQQYQFVAMSGSSTTSTSPAVVDPLLQQQQQQLDPIISSEQGAASSAAALVQQQNQQHQQQTQASMEHIVNEFKNTFGADSSKLGNDLVDEEEKYEQLVGWLKERNIDAYSLKCHPVISENLLKSRQHIQSLRDKFRAYYDKITSNGLTIPDRYYGIVDNTAADPAVKKEFFQFVANNMALHEKNNAEITRMQQEMVSLKKKYEEEKNSSTFRSDEPPPKKARTNNNDSSVASSLSNALPTGLRTDPITGAYYNAIGNRKVICDSTGTKSAEAFFSLIDPHQYAIKITPDTQRRLDNSRNPALSLKSSFNVGSTQIAYGDMTQYPVDEKGKACRAQVQIPQMQFSRSY